MVVLGEEEEEEEDQIVFPLFIGQKSLDDKELHWDIVKEQDDGKKRRFFGPSHTCLATEEEEEAAAADTRILCDVHPWEEMSYNKLHNET